MSRIKAFNYVRAYSFGRDTWKHIAIVEKVLGRRLSGGVVVHHVDEDPQNNTPTNLVLCQDEEYHRLIHRRTEAYDACGNANYQKCQYCGKWDAPESMSSVRKSDRPSTTYWHGPCRNAYRKAFRLRKGYKI